MFDRQEKRIWPVTLPWIETTVSAYLAPGRVRGNKHGECFSRQLSIYLAKHVGECSIDAARTRNGFTPKGLS